MTILKRKPVLAALLALTFCGCAAAMTGEDLETAVRGSTFDRVGDYKIGPADSLNIRVFGEESLSGAYVVAPSGMVQIPLIGFVTANGLTQVQLARQLETQLRPFVKVARVAVSMADTQSYRVFFSGEVASRGVKELKAKTSVLEGIILAGGLTDFAGGRVYLIRRLNDREVKRYVTTYAALLRGRRALDSMYLERGDIIHVE